MIIQPIDERVLLEPEDEDEKRIGLLIVPTSQKENIGIVVALGDDVIYEQKHQKPMSEILQIGDRVIYSQYGGVETHYDGKKYILLNRSDILAKVKQ